MSEVDQLVATIACRETLSAAVRVAGGDRASIAAGLIGALVVVASTAPDPLDMLDGLIASLEAARPALMQVRARLAARLAAQEGRPS